MARGFAEKEGVTILRAAWTEGPAALLRTLQVETPTKQASIEFPVRWIEELPTGRRNAAYLRRMRDLIWSVSEQDVHTAETAGTGRIRGRAESPDRQGERHLGGGTRDHDADSSPDRKAADYGRPAARDARNQS
jgi:hypothetical protein